MRSLFKTLTYLATNTYYSRLLAWLLGRPETLEAARWEGGRRKKTLDGDWHSTPSSSSYPLFGGRLLVRLPDLPELPGSPSRQVGGLLIVPLFRTHITQLGASKARYYWLSSGGRRRKKKEYFGLIGRNTKVWVVVLVVLSMFGAYRKLSYYYYYY